MSDTSNALATGNHTGFDPSIFDTFGQTMKVEDMEMDQDEMEAKKQEPSSGPVRNKVVSGNGEGSQGDESLKTPIAAPVKSACTFCRSR